LVLPIGGLIMVLFDIIHLIEYVFILPIQFLIGEVLCRKCLYYKFKCCKRRRISFEEIGYFKLRRVAEVFAETIFSIYYSFYFIISFNSLFILIYLLI